MKTPTLIVVLFLLAACAHFEPVPADYSGPTATITDTYANRKANSAHFFLLGKINGKGVASSWSASRESSNQQQFTPTMISRQVLPDSQTFTLVGLVFYPNPADGRFEDTKQFQKTITFVPVPGERYQVRGQLSHSNPDLWLEDSQGRRVECIH